MKPVKPGKSGMLPAPERLENGPGRGAETVGFSGPNRPPLGIPVFTLSHHDCVTRTNASFEWQLEGLVFLEGKIH
jgi:hypothetical protein